MRLRKLSNRLKATYSRFKVSRHLEHFNGWTNRASAKDAEGGGWAMTTPGPSRNTTTFATS